MMSVRGRGVPPSGGSRVRIGAMVQIPIPASGPGSAEMITGKVIAAYPEGCFIKDDQTGDIHATVWRDVSAIDPRPPRRGTHQPEPKRKKQIESEKNQQNAAATRRKTG